MTLDFNVKKAQSYLATKDQRLAELFKRVGPCTFELRTVRSPFQALTRAIVYQQLSGKAAGTIHGRLIDLFPTKGQVTAKNLLNISDARLRSAGVSQQKVRALRDLAQKTIEGVVPSFATLRRMDDDTIVERLTQVRGVGVWTVQMLLMFQLGRPDVLPVDDLGVRKGFQITYNKRKLPEPKALLKFGERWRPYRSIASWYFWRAADLAKAKR